MSKRAAVTDGTAFFVSRVQAYCSCWCFCEPASAVPSEESAHAFTRTCIDSYRWVRVSSARALSGMTVFSMLVNLTLGSTMSRTITQTNINLVRGLISLAVIIGFEYVTDTLSSRQGTIAKLLEKQPELLVFRGEIDSRALRRNRMSEGVLWMCLRQHGCLDVSEVRFHVIHEPLHVTFGKEVI